MAAGIWFLDFRQILLCVDLTIREISAYKSKCKLKFNHFLFLLVTCRFPMLCCKACKFNDKLTVLMSHSKVKFCKKKERKEASNATFRGRIETHISLICWFKCLLGYTLEFIGLYDMLLTLWPLQVEATAFFGNGPNKVDRPITHYDIHSAAWQSNIFEYMGVQTGNFV